ncbi:MAG: hypothetical protein ACXVRU_12745 [Gaiellaceae bacterium]
MVSLRPFRTTSIGTGVPGLIPARTELVDGADSLMADLEDAVLVETQVPNWRPPEHAACRILVLAVHAASMRAVNYAGTLGLPDTRALVCAFTRKKPNIWNACGESGRCEHRS